MALIVGLVTEVYPAVFPDNPDLDDRIMGKLNEIGGFTAPPKNEDVPPTGVGVFRVLIPEESTAAWEGFIYGPGMPNLLSFQWLLAPGGGRLIAGEEEAAFTAQVDETATQDAAGDIQEPADSGDGGSTAVTKADSGADVTTDAPEKPLLSWQYKAIFIGGGAVLAIGTVAYFWWKVSHRERV